jgi:hypothetical protein
MQAEHVFMDMVTNEYEMQFTLNIAVTLLHSCSLALTTLTLSVAASY